MRVVPLSICMKWLWRGWYGVSRIILAPFYRLGAKLLVYSVYNIHTEGFSNIPHRGAFLMISNHVSFVDGLIINAVCPRQMRFVIDRTIYMQPIVHYFMQLDHAIPISGKRHIIEQALNQVSDAFKAEESVCIFPEGQITYNGYLSHFRPGTEWIIQRDPVPIYPIYIDGLWGSMFSRKYIHKWYRFLPKDLFRDVTVICGEAMDPKTVSVDHMHQIMRGLAARARELRNQH
jgi:1-acyl-sn-glycerol-3-phosphate acyltransferase